MDKEKAERVLEKFIKLTKNDELIWKEVTEPTDLTRGTSAIIRQMFSTKYDDKNFVIYNYSDKDFDENEKAYWNTEISVVIVDNRYNTLLPFPRVSSRWSLFEIVRNQVFGGDEILDSILKK